MLLCEGAHDRHFLESLVKARGINQYDVRSNYGVVHQHGNTQFGSSLDALTGATNFRNLRGIIIISDSDTDPTLSFANICEQVLQTAEIIDKPKRRYPQPISVGVIAQGYPSLSVELMPNNLTVGNLESVLLDVIRSEHPSKMACLQQFSACMKTEVWSLGSLSKMMIGCIINASIRKEPSKSLARLWDSPDGHDLIPLSSPVFDPLCRILEGFSRVVLT